MKNNSLEELDDTNMFLIPVFKKITACVSREPVNLYLQMQCFS